MPTLRTYAEPSAADVVVIGAGINGLAITREAARRGLNVVMIDQDDLAARTSAISSRLIHGGLKYLERFEIPLVFESIRERNILLRTAPHLVRPYPMLIPFTKDGSRPGWLLSCGLIFHDVLSVGKKLPFNRIVFSRGLKRDFPGIAAGGVKWGGLFQDAHVPVTERFAVEIAIDAARNGATILTHTPVLSLIHEGGHVAGVVYRDRETGEQRSLRAPIVINAAGPWVDAVLDLDGEHERKIGPTKGSHLVVDAFPTAPDKCIFFESPDDNRPMFVLPWHNGKYMLGTTDLPYDESIDEIIADGDETDYLLRAVNTILPGAKLTSDDVLWSYSGVRPLPYVADLTDPSSVTRDSEIVAHDGDARGLFTLIGGKYTTHRALGVQALKVIERALGLPHRRSQTDKLPFPGAPAVDVDEFRARFVAASRLPRRTAERLAAVYGELAWEVAAFAAEDPSLAEIIDDETGAIAAELVYAVREEGAVNLEDVLLRRTTIALNSDVGLTVAPRAAAVLTQHVGWTQELADEELARYRHAVRRFAPRALRVKQGGGER
ncbi:D-erythritol 1-phosphate dehydrogenase [Leucobacter aridicollis]|uniref:glycerol-3-phosphate dehydrogenase/oxidase n=1 Tax=Leucobacter aridicollis TaxID=283878 RepID=UPI0021679940|nr:glycerol-3-phosphate dehydrogenase/oxidase [Leucobacter aridicollis]MCS3427413.1 glycerol-3-phosphate dehydrogenase [Leucobacter aridicollis]